MSKTLFKIVQFGKVFEIRKSTRINLNNKTIMKKGIITIGMLSALFLTSCKETPKETTDVDVVETEVVANDVNTVTSTDKNGKTLEVTYDNAKDVATIKFDGQTSELIGQKPASGMWYKNDQYELRGKGNDIELKKDGVTIFEHTDDIVTSSLKDSKGNTLDMTYNNDAGTVKVYVNGGEQIDMVAERAASGIWYKNDQYELRGKGENLELTKDGKTVFKN